MKRIVWGKSIGFGVGLVGFLSIPYVFPDASMMLRVGVLVWYTLVGAMVAVTGVVDRHPLCSFRLTSFIRGAMLGASMNIALVLIAFETLSTLMQTSVWFAGMSPFWLVAEGLVVGMIIDVIITKKTGEGASLCAGQ